MPDGAVFRVGNEWDYVKLYHNNCRAYVRPLASARHNVVKKPDGSTAEWDSPGGCVNIGPETMGVVVSLPRDDGTPVRTAAVAQKRGGKQPQAPLKKANPATKRGQILAFLMEDPTGETRIADVEKKFGIKRGLVMTHCYEIWRDHGVGYEVLGEVVRIAVETDPFQEVSTFDDLI